MNIARLSPSAGSPPASSPSRRSRTSGFSLIEVTMALGVVCFAMLTVLGLLPVGLSILSGAATRTGQTHIAKAMSTEVQEISLAEVNALPGQTYYYDRSGTPVSAQDAFFSASFAINSPSIPGVPNDYSTIAKTVVVTLHYPQSVPAASQKIATFSLLAAQQSGN